MLDLEYATGKRLTEEAQWGPLLGIKWATCMGHTHEKCMFFVCICMHASIGYNMHNTLKSLHRVNGRYFSFPLDVFFKFQVVSIISGDRGSSCQLVFIDLYGGMSFFGMILVYRIIDECPNPEQSFLAITPSDGVWEMPFLEAFGSS